MAAPELTVIHLGTFDLDLHSGELSRAGRRVHLPAQSSRLLVLLARRAPEVVSRDEIRVALWGKELHVEFDAAVNACISQIRSALGDSARAPRFIQTVPRSGYRCLVERLPATATRSEHTELVSSGSRTSASAILIPGSQRVAAAMTFALVAAVSLLVWTVSASVRTTGSDSLVATQKFERGSSGLSDAGPSELVDRVRHFEAAIAADPEFAQAYAGLANAKLLIGTYRVEPPQIAYAAAKSAAERALSLNPRLGDAHAAFGASVLYFEWDWTRARQHLHQAVVLDPRSSRAQLWWSRYLTAAGDHDRAVLAARRAVTLAPGSPSALTALGIAQYYARRPDDARRACAEAAAIMREFVPAQICLQAVTVSRSPNALLVPATNLVRTGDRERAIDWLQRAANRRSDSLIFAAVEPGLDPLRSDPRFDSLLKRVGWKNVNSFNPPPGADESR